MFTLYEYIHNICNYKYVSSLGSINQDLVRFYNYNKEFDLDTILNNFNSIYEEFWKKVDKQNAVDDEVKDKIKLITPDVNKYTNIIKIDFKRAFTNYGINYLTLESLRLYNYFCNKISRAYILPESKKFLYNYVLTNIILSYSGKSKLNQLRYDVYEDVMYMASRYGEVIKSEVDGCYVLTNEHNYSYLEIYGEYSIFKYDYIYFLDKGIQISQYNKKLDLKGLNKNDPNIYSMIIKSFLKKFDDSVLNNYFYRELKIPVIDWCKKSKDGNTGTVCLKHSVINVDTKTEEDVYNLDKYKESLSRNMYFNKISNILQQLLLLR